MPSLPKGLVERLGGVVVDLAVPKLLLEDVGALLLVHDAHHFHALQWYFLMLCDAVLGKAVYRIQKYHQYQYQQQPSYHALLNGVAVAVKDLGLFSAELASRATDHYKYSK